MRSSPHSCELAPLVSRGLLTPMTPCPPDTLTDSPPQEQCGSVSGLCLHTGHGGGRLLPWKVHAECHSGAVSHQVGALQWPSAHSPAWSGKQQKGLIFLLDLKAPEHEATQIPEPPGSKVARHQGSGR